MQTMKIINWNQGWKFVKPNDETIVLDLPHTWNGIDGQDGGDDYYRGTCHYLKNLKLSDLDGYDDVYLEINGANSSSEVFVNGKSVGKHDGGYSTYRVNITPYLNDVNKIDVAVDNSPNDYVYPQKADFTFYGGLYRDVNLIYVNKKRFDLDYYGGPGVKITPTINDKDADVEVEAYLTNVEGNEKLIWQIYDGDKLVVEKETLTKETKVNLTIKDVHLWHGRKDPHLYTLHVRLVDNNETVDERNIKFGCRSFKIDANKGFILNGQEYPLHGVSRHQDRPKKGNALSKEDHKEDIDLILELGATSIRLAHYQHDQYFYDLCDEYGLVVWAEIPYISNHLVNGKENTISQMNELIVQNYNHPCIVVWGLSNEITMGGAIDDAMIENHHELNDLCHKLDKTRLTTEAVLTMCPIDSPYVHIPDVLAYNHYYGWYGGTTDMNGKFFDNFHSKYPEYPIGISEYGCEALNWHSSNPVQGDYTEEYQAYYHEELIKQLFTRPYIWCTYVWNMFDFGADARSEGGEDGMNHKGLVTFDRKYKKDSFYAYKAWLSKEPFVHICSKRYIDRVEDTTKVTIYSNCDTVELFVNGKSLGKQSSDNHFFYFNVPNIGETKLVAKTNNDCSDESLIRKVDKPNEDYIMKENGDVLNWFEITTKEGYFSINDKIGDILANPKGAKYLKRMLFFMMLKHKKELDVNKKNSKMGSKEGMANMKDFISGFTLKRIISMAGMGMGIHISKEETLKINKQLNKIKKR